MVEIRVRQVSPVDIRPGPAAGAFHDFELSVFPIAADGGFFSLFRSREELIDEDDLSLRGCRSFHGVRELAGYPG